VRHVTFLLIISVASFGWGADPTPAPKDPLYGAWALTSGVKAGDKVAPDLLKKSRMALVYGKYRSKMGDQVNEGTYTTDQTKKPATMTVTITKGPDEGKTILAIYELDKGNLKVCFDLSGKAFPETFESKSGTQIFLANYERFSLKRMPPRLSGGAKK
jgi:uncharacterized protein (TIGR03067 family)